MLSADLHVHLGRDRYGKAVKVTASRNLTLSEVRRWAGKVGMDVIGIVDSSSPGVAEDFADLESQKVGGGGYLGDGLLVIPGVEVEVTGEGPPYHALAYFPGIDGVRRLEERLDGARQVSPRLFRGDLKGLTAAVREAGGETVLAHAFTPFKGYFGPGPREGSLPRQLLAVELGLSADTDMARRLKALEDLPFVSSSDAHSGPKIGREFTLIEVAERSFRGLVRALRGEEGGIVTNCGLDPRLGKYYRTFCEACGWKADELPPVFSCPRCGPRRVTGGVLDRVATLPGGSRTERPPYRHMVPLSFIPGIGPRTADRLLEAFGSQYAVLFEAEPGELEAVAGRDRAARILELRQGKGRFETGGGGRYGRYHAEE